MHFFTCFSLGDFTFLISAQKWIGLGEIRKAKSENGLIIYDDLSFIRYIADYSGASSSPDHRVQTLIKFIKGVFSSNGDVIWLLRIDYSIRIPMDVGL